MINDIQKRFTTHMNFELIESIKSLNEKCGDLLSKINLSNFINSTEDQNYNYLKELFTKENTQNCYA